MNSRRLVIAASVLILLVAIAYRAGYDSRPTPPRGTSEDFKVTGQVEVRLYRYVDGEYRLDKVLVTSNLIVDEGKTWVRDQLAGTINTQIARFISVSTNAVVCATGDTQATADAQEQTTLGFSRVSGTVAKPAFNQYTVTTTYTATGTVNALQKSFLLTNSNTGDATEKLLACNTFSSVNVVNTDQLTITWTITIS